MYLDRRLVMVAGVALTLAGPVARADQPMILGGTGVMGGPGGDQFVLMCPPDSFLAGAVMRRGDLLDRYEPLCAYVQADGSTGPQFASGRGAGGEGGDAVRESCPAGYVVDSIYVERPFSGNQAGQCGGARLDYTEEPGTIVGCVEHVCRRAFPPFDLDVPVESSYQGPVSSRGWSACPPGQWPVGVYGRAGILIDSIGLVCGPAFGPYATAHLPPPEPERPQIAVPLSEADTELMFGPEIGNAVGPVQEFDPNATAVAGFDFAGPTIGGYGVDICLNWGTNCGQPAADAFCRSQGYAASVSHEIQSDAPPTLVIGDNVVCGEAFCDRFSFISCR